MGKILDVSEKLIPSEMYKENYNGGFHRSDGENNI